MRQKVVRSKVKKYREGKLVKKDREVKTRGQRQMKKQQDDGDMSRRNLGEGEMRERPAPERWTPR